MVTGGRVQLLEVSNGDQVGGPAAGPGQMDTAEMMEALEEESYALAVSSASKADFDSVAGTNKDIINEDAEFQVQQRNFMDKYYQEFEDTEENKFTYTTIFNKHLSLVEKYIKEQLLEQMPGFDTAAFTKM